MVDCIFTIIDVYKDYWEIYPTSNGSYLHILRLVVLFIV